MITKWEIFVNIDPQTSAMHYSLYINGTEHDARFLAKKLKNYIQPPLPASAPYVYNFPLPDDLDEDTQAKIRASVQESIRQMSRVNEFNPGGSFAEQLYQPGTEQEDKAFPSFTTLDPSESFFRKTNFGDEGTLPPPVVQGGPFDLRTIDLTAPAAPIQANEASVAKPLPQGQDNSPQVSAIDVSVETVKPEAEGLTTLSSIPTPPQPVQKPDEPQPQQNPLSAAAQQPSIDDILLAKTRYDMFMDMGQTNSNTAKSSEPVIQQTPLQQPVSFGTDDFNIFEQKIKDQTCFMDVDDVEAITQRITQKDLGFVQYAQVNPAPQQQHTPAEPVQPTVQPTAKEIPMPTLSAAWAQSEENDEQGEVMDPFEQLLAATPKETEPSPSSQQAPQETASSKQTPAEAAEEAGEMTKELEAVFGPQENTEKNNMTDKTVEPKKPLLRLKRKEQVPTIPHPPLPPTSAAPKPPLEPTPAPVVQEEEHQTVLRRRRVNTQLVDKTTTIDHSIQVPLTELQKHNWPLEVPLVPTYTLENMTISVNRFAHATAISVIDNPGKLYNPLVLHGNSGTGKTHFLHAIGYALSKKFGQENVFITNGVRLSRGIQRYIMEGKIHEFEEFTASVKALLIDDIHLISINEQNRTHLSKLLNDFRTQHKQIVITSKYPPENLAKLEELLNFKLDSGWISELKQAQGPARMRIIQKMLIGNNINISNDDITRFFGQADMSLGSVVRSIRRVRVLEKLMHTHDKAEKPSSLSIFNQLLAVNGEDQTSQIAQKSIHDISTTSVMGNGEWGRIGFFYPQNHPDMMDWLLFAIQQRAKELGIPGGPELAVRSSYSTDNIISSAFKIANLCDNRKLKGAIILGPKEEECDPSVRDNFYDIITHMLEIMLIRCGVINYEQVNLPSTYVKILSELLR